MAKKKKRSRRDIPYCADPENHVLVETREGIFWRKKRKKTALNEALATNVDLSKISGPAARQVVEKLRPYFKGLEPGRITLRISNGLRKALKEKKRMDYSFLHGLELQREHKLHQLLLAAYRTEILENRFSVIIPIESNSVKRQNRLATHFYFEAVLLSGDAGVEQGLRGESTESRLYSFDAEGKEDCMLSLPLPEHAVPWMVLLKVSCLEGHELAVHPKHYGMKVVASADANQ